MSIDQAVTLAVLIAVIAALIWNKLRADVVAMTGAAVLLVTGAVRPSEVQGAFGSPAIIALASLFVIVYAIELSGLLDRLIDMATRLCRRIGAAGLWILIGACGSASAFLNNTPIVVLASPVIRDAAQSLKLSPKRFLMPLSYMAVLGGTCTLIGTSTNLLVNDMARIAGQPTFGIFEIAPVGILLTLTGGAYLFLVSGRIGRSGASDATEDVPLAHLLHPDHVEFGGAQVGSGEVFAERRPLQPKRAVAAVLVFVGVIAAAALGVAPIAASAFAGAILLILLRIITVDEAYRGLRPEILLLIAGMIVLGIAMEETGLAAAATGALIEFVEPLGPLVALIALYGATLFLTEILSNAAVAVLVAPIAVALAESLGVSPRPFLVAVMMAASAAFATPFGYQTNVIVYQLGNYSYMDFVRIGLPLDLLTWAVAVAAISYMFPF